MPALFPAPFSVYFDNNGNPLSGGLVYTYVANSLTPLATYSDAAGTLNANPVQLDSAGRADIWYDGSKLYKIVLKTSAGATVKTVDNVGNNSTGVYFLQAGTGAVSRTMQSKAREIVSAEDFGTVGGSTDDLAAINAASLAVFNAGGGDVELTLPAYTISGPLTWRSGVRFVGKGAIQRGNGAVTPCKISCTGSGGVAITPGASVSVINYEMENIHFDGLNSSTNSDGMFLDATAANSVIQGVRTRDCAFTNFKRNQIRSDGTVFDVLHDRITLHNYSNAASDCVLIQNGVPGQWTFLDPLIIPATAGTWAIKQTTGFSLRTVGGTIGPTNAGAGANGIYANCGLSVLGTHLEGHNGAQTGTIGIQYLGSVGATILPSYCATFGTGVQIGDGTSTTARGWMVGGAVGGYNSGGGGDLVITAGGDRTGIIGQLSYVGGTPVIVNNRYSTDGVLDVAELPKLVYKTVDFTPVAQGASAAGVGTYTNQVGRATRIGNRVDFSLRVSWSAHTGTGALQVAGLPWNSESSAPFTSFSLRADALSAGDTTAIQAYLGQNSSTINIEKYTAGASGIVSVAATGDLMISGHYFV